MQKITITFNYRKCIKCGAVTHDMKKDTCKCGGYMYMMGGYYTPKNPREGAGICRC